MSTVRSPRSTSLLLSVPALLVAMFSLSTFVGSLWWPLDLAANFRPHFATALITLGVALLAARRTKSAVFVLIVGIINASVVLPLFVGPSSIDEMAGASVRVMSFNVFGQNDEYQAVIDYIRNEAPDVVFIHEATFLWEDAFAAANLGYRVERGRREPLDFGTVALVPFDSQFQTFGFATSEPRAVEVTMLVDGVAVKLLGIHPLSPYTEERASLRDAQLGFARNWSSEVTGPRIVAGDFNATPWSHSFRSLVRHGDLGNSQRGYGLELSFPSESNPLFQVPIDHLLHSREFRVTDRTLGPAMGSDHLPIVVDLQLAGGDA